MLIAFYDGKMYDIITYKLLHVTLYAMCHIISLIGVDVAMRNTIN